MVAALFFHKFRFIGLQQESKQWGSLVLNTYNKSVNLPLSTTAANYAVTIITNFAAAIDSGAWGSVALISRSTTQFVCNKDFGETDKTAYWILAGY